MKSPLKVSLLPMTSTDDCQKNLKTIEQGVSLLPADTDLLCLPENSLFINISKPAIDPGDAFTHNSLEIYALQELAKKKSLAIHLGGIPWLIDGKVFNEALLIRANGQLDQTYEKIHLFDVDLGPGIQVTESKSYNPGHRFGRFEINGWKLATCICYDLRFPELFLSYMQEDPVDAFIVPAAFTTKTGKLHWKALLQARAIECQAYVLAAAQVGWHRTENQQKLRKSWGQSLVIDPWGKILQESPSFAAFLDSDLTEHPPMNTVLEEKKIQEVRKSIPVKDHRRFFLEIKEK